MNIKEMIKKIHSLAVEKGWWEEKETKYVGVTIPRDPAELFANFHGEISEAWEEYRKGHKMTEIYFKDGKPEGIPIELADCIIRIFDACGEYGIDIEAAIEMKHEFNKTRTYRHNGKIA